MTVAVSLEVRDLTVEIESRAGTFTPVRGVRFDIRDGDRLGIVGESGSGKSLTALAIMGLLPAGIRVGGGAIRLFGRDLVSANERELASVRGNEIGMIYQNPHSSLNPVQTIGRQLTEALRLNTELSQRERQDRARELLEEVGIAAASERLDSHPHEFSGGMKQRVMIAMALAGSPRVLIADEITTALDVTTQATIIDLLDRLASEHGLSVVLISHDLGVASKFCSRIAVMYAGRLVEVGEADEFFRRPFHPYSRGLLRSICRLDADVGEPLPILEGEPLTIDNFPEGCSFAPRCAFVEDECRRIEQVPDEIAGRIIECSRLSRPEVRREISHA